MGNVSLNKNNRLYWLGRYSERLYQGVKKMSAYQDVLIDDTKIDYEDICRRLGITRKFESDEQFCHAFLFDRTMPESLINAAEAMLGNGMVLRETISTTTLSYVQMAVTAMDLASKSKASDVELQWVIDDIFAFRGCCFDYIENESVRNTIKCGISVERLSTMLTFDETDDVIMKEVQRLLNRLYKTSVKKDAVSLSMVTAYCFDEEGKPDKAALKKCVENLFQV